MKRLQMLLAGAAMLTAPSAAAVTLSGDAQISYAYGEVDDNNGNDFVDGDVREVAATARIGAVFDSGLFLQADGFYEQGGEDYDPDPAGPEDAARNSFGAHAGYRAEAFHAGAFYASQWTEYINVSSDENYQSYGVEGQYHFDRFSLSAQLGRADSDSTGNWHDIEFATVGGAFFATPNLRFSGSFTRADGEVEGVDEAPHTRVSLEGRRRFGERGLSAFARYDRGTLNNETETPNDELVDNVFSLGLAFTWGGGETLQDYERQGASLQSPNALLRYMGYSQDYD